jgi:ketosteroid isomerase-like protein
VGENGCLALTLAEATALFERRRAAWLAADVAAYLGCWVDDLVLETPGRVLRGRDEYRRLLERSFAWARPRSFEFHHLAVNGDVVLAEWTISVERRAGGAVEWRGMSVSRVHDGRIVWWREYYADPAALARAADGVSSGGTPPP